MASQYSSIRITLFKDGRQSFLAALDHAQIPHNQIQTYSSAPQAAGLIEAITALSGAMPWNAVARVIVAWIEARATREIRIQGENGESLSAKGYSVQDVERMLQRSTNVIVIDTKPQDET